MDRKVFFKDGLHGLAKNLWQSPVGKIVDRQLHGVANLLSPQGLEHHLPDVSQKIEDTLVRPPGAIDSPEFDEQCSKCNDCIEVCPHGTIFEWDQFGPVIHTNTMACLLCADFPCISACKEGALLPLAEDQLPAFGHALVKEADCANVELPPRSEDHFACKECLDVCPVPGALEFKQGSFIPQITAACNGCGQCLPVCPVFPVALEIIPLDEEDVKD